MAQNSKLNPLPGHPILSAPSAREGPAPPSTTDRLRQLRKSRRLAKGVLQRFRAFLESLFDAYERCTLVSRHWSSKPEIWWTS